MPSEPKRIPERVVFLNGENGPCLVIRGEDPAEIHRLAVEWLADEEDPEWCHVTGDADEVLVHSIRVINWCPSYECGCDRPGPHYIDARQGSRGSFRGSFVGVHYITTDEMQQREAEVSG